MLPVTLRVASAQTSLARRLLATLLLLAGCLVLAPAPAAYACDCSSQTVAQQVDRADAVFTGLVSAPPEKDGERLVYQVQVDRVYAGSVDAEVELHTASQGTACGLTDLPVDEPVMFFVRGSGASVSATSCGGTTGASPRLVRRVEEQLGAGEAPAEPAAPAPEQSREATFTPVADGEPATFTRVAAPGLAMVIVGLLGLLLVRRLGDR